MRHAEDEPSQILASAPSRARRWNVLDADDLGVFVVAPAGAEFYEVEATVGAEFHVHRALEGHFRTEPFHLRDAIIRIEVDSNDPVPGPFVDEQGVIILCREF